MKQQRDTILITGSSGRIGYPLAKRMAESFNVAGFDRRAPSLPPAGVKQVSCRPEKEHRKRWLPLK